MKIALLNLPIDNNYGGNLQRYALMKILQDMGHDVTHIFLKVCFRLPWYKYPYSYSKRLFKKYVLRRSVHILYERYRIMQYEKDIKTILPFYERYIKHTKVCYNIDDIMRETNNGFDLFIVGSDQVWRKSMTDSIGWENFLFSFLKNNTKRIAYGISFGIDDIEYKKTEYDSFVRLYSKFEYVSVRENSAINLLKQMGCRTPKAAVVLDPTFLIEKEDYVKLFSCLQEPIEAKDKIFCYILDMDSNVKQKIAEISNKTKLGVIIAGLSDNQPYSVEKWLKSIYEAKYVITDSYHGTIFSIIFNKPFAFVGNKRRGNTRINSLFEQFNLMVKNRGMNLDNEDVWITPPNQEVISIIKKSSIFFLSNCLKEMNEMN